MPTPIAGSFIFGKDSSNMMWIFVSSNIQSINAKINELKIFIVDLREKGLEF